MLARVAALATGPSLASPGGRLGVYRAHWARYAGRNFTHRQMIKRKAENWARRYAAMPPAERLAVLAALMTVEAHEQSPALVASLNTPSL